MFDFLFGKKNSLSPPKGKIFVGYGEFKSQGERILKQFITYGRLKPAHRVLDVGCGIGRTAIPLATYLAKEGSYEGFDIVKPGIAWCKKHVSTTFTNFNFIHVNLKNNLYNLKTDKKAKYFIFPYPDEDFDFVCLTSVFTHMLPEDVNGYLKQIYRVLKHNGICYATFFIINEEGEKYMQTYKGLKFPFRYKNYYLHNKNVKEANVAYDEGYLKNELIGNSGLVIEKIYYGYWTGRKKGDSLDFQDTIILKK